MQKSFIAIALALLLASPAWADSPALLAHQAGLKRGTELPVATREPPAAPAAARAKDICILVADPANKTLWLAHKLLDQWVPCQAGQAIGVRWLETDIQDAAEAHFCQAAAPIERTPVTAGELGLLKCTYAGSDLASGRKSDDWDIKPLAAAVPYHWGSLNNPIVAGERRATPAPQIEPATAATGRPGKGRKAG